MWDLHNSVDTSNPFETNPVYVAGDAGDFIDRYVFPYHELPHVSRATHEMSRKSFEVTDIEALRPHYSLTLRHWLDRLESNQLEAERLAGERRFRIWRAYLAGSAYAFERGWISIRSGYLTGFATLFGVDVINRKFEAAVGILSDVAAVSLKSFVTLKSKNYSVCTERRNHEDRNDKFELLVPSGPFP